MSLRRRARGRWAAAVIAWWLSAAGAQPVPADCPPPARAPSADQAQSALRDARDRGFLWRIARDDRVSYLYGTLHVAHWQWMYPGPRIARALAASDTVALELDMLDPDIVRRLAAGMAADPAERLPDALAERLRRQVDAACLPRQAMLALAPAVQMAALTTLAARHDGLDPAFAIDSFLAGYARAQGKAVMSLESPELQLALLKGEASTAQQELDSALRQLELGQARPMLVRIAQVWADGRADELARYEQWCECVDTESDRASLKRLLDDRNPALAGRIDAEHAGGRRVFAAVGALHMVGPLGLPALMAQRGYDVQRVELEP